MTSHYVSQENDPAHALHELLQAFATLRKFETVRFYGDHALLCAAAAESTLIGKRLTEMAWEVDAIRQSRLQAAE